MTQTIDQRAGGLPDFLVMSGNHHDLISDFTEGVPDGLVIKLCSEYGYLDAEMWPDFSVSGSQVTQHYAPAITQAIAQYAELTRQYWWYRPGTTELALYASGRIKAGRSTATGSNGTETVTPNPDAPTIEPVQVYDVAILEKVTQAEQVLTDVQDLKNDTQTIYDNAVTLKGQMDAVAEAVAEDAGQVAQDKLDIAADRLYVEQSLPEIVAANENVTTLAGQVADNTATVHDEMLQAQANRYRYIGPWQANYDAKAGDAFGFRLSFWRKNADGSTGATFNPADYTLLSAGYNDTGAWAANTDYFVNDLAENGGNIYRRLTNGQSGSTFSGVGTNWKVFIPGASVADGSVGRAKLSPELSAFLAFLKDSQQPDFDGSAYARVWVDEAGRIGFFIDKAGKLGTPQQSDIGTSVSRINARSQEIDHTGKYIWGVTDEARRAAIAIDKAGVFYIRDVDILALIRSVTDYRAEWYEESGFLWARTDEARRAAIAIDKAGNLWLKGQRADSIFATGASLTNISNYVIPSPEIVCVGDSLTEAGYPAILSQSIGRACYNMGIGGQSSTQIAFRQGGKCVALTVSGFQIPASGSVTVTPADTEIMFVSRSVTGTLMGIPGTLARAAGGAYSFTRTTAGSAVGTDKVCMFGTDGGGHNNKITVIWAGRNNFYSPSTVLADIAAMVSNLSTSNKRFVVLSVINSLGEITGGSDYDKIVNQVNAVLRTTYPRNYLDVREALIRSYNPSLTQDVTDYNNDTPPTSLRSDNIHLNTAGYTIVANAVKDFIIQKNW